MDFVWELATPGISEIKTHGYIVMEATPTAPDAARGAGPQTNHTARDCIISTFRYKTDSFVHQSECSKLLSPSVVMVRSATYLFEGA